MERVAETRILAVEDTADPGKSKLRTLEIGALHLEIVGGQGRYTTSDSQVSIFETWRLEILKIEKNTECRKYKTIFIFFW